MRNLAEGISLPPAVTCEHRSLTDAQVHERAVACSPDYRLMVLFLPSTVVALRSG